MSKAPSINSNGVRISKVTYHEKRCGEPYLDILCNLEYLGQLITEQSHAPRIVGSNEHYSLLEWIPKDKLWRLLISPPSQFNQDRNQAIPVRDISDWKQAYEFGPKKSIKIRFNNNFETYLDLWIEPPVQTVDNSSNFEGEGKHTPILTDGEKGFKEKEDDLEIYNEHATSDHIYGWAQKKGPSWLWVWNLSNKDIGFIAYKINSNTTQEGIVDKMNRFIQGKLLCAIRDYEESVASSTSSSNFFKDDIVASKYGNPMTYYLHGRFLITIQRFIDSFYKAS